MSKTVSVILKWGTLKGWNIKGSKEAKALLEEYFDIGSCVSTMMQRDTTRQKEIICELIDLCTAKTIYMDWDGKRVSKEEAKKYVMEYA